MNVNLKSLVGRLNDVSRGALEGAAGLCLSRTNYDVEIEHILAKLLEQDDTDLHKIATHFEVNIDRLTKDVSTALDRLKSGNSRTPGLSDRIPNWIQDAWLLASVDFGAARVRSGHLVLALLANDRFARIAREVSKEFDHISLEKLQSDLPDHYGRFGRGTRCCRTRRNGRRFGRLFRYIRCSGQNKSARSIYRRPDGQSRRRKDRPGPRPRF